MKKILAEELLRSILLYEKNILQRAKFHMDKGLRKLKNSVDFNFNKAWMVSKKLHYYYKYDLIN